MRFVRTHVNVCPKTYMSIFIAQNVAKPILNEMPIPEIKLPHSFSLESVNIVVKGICSNCKE